MPDEKENYKASQSAHAQKIRTERAVMDMTGASRSQIRSALANFARQQITPEVAVPQEPKAKPEPTPVLPVVEQKFEPRPFVLGDTKQQAPQAMPNVMSLRLVTATIAVTGSENVPDGGLFRTFTVALDVPNGTPLMVDTGAQTWPIQFVGSYVSGGTAFIQFWSDIPTTLSAGTITINAVIPLN